MRAGSPSLLCWRWAHRALSGFLQRTCLFSLSGRSRAGHRKVTVATTQPGVFLRTCWCLSRGWGRGQPGRAGPAKLVQPVPGPFHSHSCGLGTTSSSRPAGARPAQCGGCGDSPLPRAAWAADHTRLALPCQASAYPWAWAQGLPLRIRRKFTPTHPPTVSLGLLALAPGTSPSYK